MEEPAPASPIPIERFRALMMAEVPALHRLSRHVARNGSEADDLLQETVLRALRSSSRFLLGLGGIRPWLFQILYNTYRNMRRDQPRERLYEILDNDLQAADTSTVSVDRASGKLDWQQVDEEIYYAVQQLREEYRMVFILFAVEDLKYREIGEVLGLPIGTVMSRLARARQQLLSRLPNRRSAIGSRPAEPDACSEVSVSDD